jgi:hypothetical protein
MIMEVMYQHMNIMAAHLMTGTWRVMWTDLE